MDHYYFPNGLIPSTYEAFKIHTVLEYQSEICNKLIRRWSPADESYEVQNDKQVNIKFFEGPLTVGLSSIPVLKAYWQADLDLNAQRWEEHEPMRPFFQTRIDSLQIDLKKLDTALTEILQPPVTWVLIPEWFYPYLIAAEETIVFLGQCGFWLAEFDKIDIILKIIYHSHFKKDFFNGKKSTSI